MKFFITGGTGSLGRALTKRLLSDGHTVVIYSRDEGKQALTFKGMAGVECVIGDVRDLESVRKAVKRHAPDRIIHAAALKRIDDMEMYPEECLKTNVDGSKNIALAAMEYNVPKCILVSTDKACMPVNVYGSSKFIAERLYTNFDFDSENTILSSVRYGNVIASRGSFIPLWLEKLRNGERISLTSLDCTRFLFKLSDAVSTVLDSLEMSEGGEVFIPKIPSFKIPDVLDVLEDISGKKVPFDVIGLRPGEKIHEDMLGEIELPQARLANDKISVVLPQYTKRTHSFPRPYTGPEMSSGKCLSDDLDELKTLILEGLDDAN